MNLSFTTTVSVQYLSFSIYANLIDFLHYQQVRLLLRKKSDSTDRNTCFNRPEIRCSCQACMKINLINGSYFVYEFVPEHNHILATPEQRHQLRSQSKIDEAQISRIEVAKFVGISAKAVIDLLAKEAGGIENLGFTRLDVKNRLYTKRSLLVQKGDTGGVLEYMERRSSEDAKFFYFIQVDEDDL
jgi:zinc finger SWIM domain-containing protein 3